MPGARRRRTQAAYEVAREQEAKAIEPTPVENPSVLELLLRIKELAIYAVLAG